MNNIFLLAGQEINIAVRNRWIVGATLLLAGLAFVLAFLGSTPTGAVMATPLTILSVNLAGLNVFLIPLIALFLSFDAVVGAAERGTLVLLLSFPISRFQVLVGQFLGYSAVLAVAVIIGYGGAGLGIGLLGGADAAAWVGFALLIAASITLGGVFSALGILVSVMVYARSTAAAVTVGLWLWFVVLHDMLLLGLLVKSAGWVGTNMFHLLLLANPADVFRMLALTSFENIRAYGGLPGIASLPAIVLGAVLGAWVILPLGLAMILFRRQEA